MEYEIEQTTEVEREKACHVTWVVCSISHLDCHLSVDDKAHATEQKAYVPVAVHVLSACCLNVLLVIKTA